MKVEKKDLPKSQVELQIEIDQAEFKKYIEKGTIKVGKEVKIEGFRPGKVPFEVLKQKIGEMTILEESARLAINATLGEAIEKHVEKQAVGQPKVDIVKLAPNNPLVYKVVLALLPKLSLGEYKDLKIKQKKVEIDDKEIEKTIAEFREMRAQEKKVERKIQDKDKALVDIQMFLDNVPMEDGQKKDTAIIIGKDYIVSGFDKQLTNMEKGDKKEFKLPYPKDFHMKNLAGKMVDFKVTIKDVFERVLPEINDDFVKSFGMKKVGDFKKAMGDSIKNQKEHEQAQATERAMLEKIMDKTKFGDIPEMLVDSETHNMLHELEDSLAQQGAKFDDYLKSLNKTKDQLTLDLLPEAVKRVKISLLIREIANKEKLKAEEKDIDEYIEKMKQTHKDNKEALERLSSADYRSHAANLLSSRKVVDNLKKWNVVK
ncbi:MAG: trigger factor [Patescibacteria group bacterium]|nr:trigger factor [Patescibacteria group bacterium]